MLLMLQQNQQASRSIRKNQHGKAQTFQHPERLSLRSLDFLQVTMYWTWGHFETCTLKLRLPRPKGHGKFQRHQGQQHHGSQMEVNKVQPLYNHYTTIVQPLYNLYTKSYETLLILLSKVVETRNSMASQDKSHKSDSKKEASKTKKEPKSKKDKDHKDHKDHKKEEEKPERPKRREGGDESGWMRNALTVSDASCCFMLLPHLTCAVRLCIWSAEQYSKLSRSKRNEQGQAPQKIGSEWPRRLRHWGHVLRHVQDIA